MRRIDQTCPPRRVAAIATALAATGLVLTACGGADGTASSSRAPSSGAPTVEPAKALTAQDVPAGLTLDTVPADSAMMTALQAVQQVQDATVEPAACKDKNLKAQQEVAATVKSGVQQTVRKGEAVLYGITLLPGDVAPAIFEAAGTGECAQVGFGPLKQETVRKDLPAGTDGATGFVFDITRKDGDKTAAGSSAYFTKGGVTVMLNANAAADGTIDRPGFEDMIRRVAAKL
ncbi:hypothetical protein GCM10027289_17870 [Tsukamurella serpentis]